MKKSVLWILILASIFQIAEVSAKDTSGEDTLRPFTFQDAMKFRRCRYQSISDYGNYIGYTAIPDRGDAVAYVSATGDSLYTYEIERGRKVVFSSNELWAATLVSPEAIDKANDKKNLKKGLALLNLQTGEITEHEDVSSFEFSENSGWLVFKHGVDSDEYKSAGKNKPKGYELVLKHLQSGTDIKIEHVNDYALDSTSMFCFYTISAPDGKRDGVYVRNLAEVFAPESAIEKGDSAIYGNPKWNHKKRVLAYTKSKVAKNDTPDSTELKVWLYSNNLNVSVLKPEDYPEEYYLPHDNKLAWTEDGKRLFFGLKPLVEKDTTYGEEDEVKFDEDNYYDLGKIHEEAEYKIWHPDDKRITPHREKWWSQNKDRTFAAVYHLETNKWVQLGSLELPNVPYTDSPGYAIGYDPTPYLKEITYNGWFYDIYLVDLQTGEKSMVTGKALEGAHLSPTGKYLAYFKSKHWWLYDIENNKKDNKTIELKTPFFDNTNEVPAEPGSFGFLGWHEDDKHFYVYDKYDMWRFNTVDDGFMNMFAADGKVYNHRYRIRDFKKNRKTFSYNDTLLVENYSFDDKDTEIGFMTLDKCSAEMFYFDSAATNRFLDKAEKTDQYLVSRESYHIYPDLWTGSFGMEDRKQITDLYPEMRNLEWGTSHICRFTNSAGDSLDGYYIVPHDFDPGKKYPLMVYIYEKFSHRTFRFYEPRINHRPSYQIYNSSGYVIFIPDIKYTVGQPGPDALDCVMGGVDALLTKGFIDSTKMCLQGHSWGAYEGAYIATQTDRFKAICAGAPVSNMTSAYSGIRLGSGLARQFQYEKYQSRIGTSLFESLDKYIANSPVFEAEKAEVPLLILHGDVDGAVPWQQSIELYLAYRRLGKECIFIQYEKEPHWPSRYANKIDWAMKMKQFFDTYCLEKEAPEWLEKGSKYYEE